MKKFIVLAQFDRSLNIRYKEGNAFVNAQPFSNPIIYEDSNDGDLIFRGFFPFQYVQLKHCLLVFKAHVIAREGGYNYTISDFEVVEFIHAPKTKSKGSGTYWGYGVSTSKNTTSFSDGYIRTVPLEKFMLNLDYAITSDKVFNDGRKEIIELMEHTVANDLD
ncbi:MAG: hypothetical protein JSS64_03160 [Bacteroidetes bacterium]|nr:hypothetical protein [Bacteroidota bacterium]